MRRTVADALEILATLVLLAIVLPGLYLLTLLLRRPMTGKGDTPRPLSVPPDVLEANWKATFPEPPKADQPPETLGDPEE